MSKLTQTEMTAFTWTLITTLHTAQYSIKELMPELKKADKNSTILKAMGVIDRNISSFVKLGQGNKATKKEKELLESLSYESVAVIAQTVAIISHLPPDSIDHFCEKVDDLARSIIMQNISETKKE